MYIINHGRVDVRDGEKVIVSLEDGMFFGEQALIKHTTRNADVISTSYCDLYILEKDDFLTLIQLFPELIRNMDTTLHEIQAIKKKLSKKRMNLRTKKETKLKLAS